VAGDRGFSFNGWCMKTIVSRAKAYLKVRHQSARKAMKQLKLDGLLLTHPPDLAYLTNFTRERFLSRHRFSL
jgi:hypothetical protein